MASIARGQESNEIVPDLNASETGLLILDTIEGLGLRARLAGKKPAKAARAALRRMVRDCLEVAPA